MTVCLCSLWQRRVDTPLIGCHYWQRSSSRLMSSSNGELNFFAVDTDKCWETASVLYKELKHSCTTQTFRLIVNYHKRKHFTTQQVARRKWMWQKLMSKLYTWIWEREREISYVFANLAHRYLNTMPCLNVIAHRQIYRHLIFSTTGIIIMSAQCQRNHAAHTIPITLPSLLTPVH